MHTKIGLQNQVQHGICKIISLKINRLRTDTSAGGKCKLLTPQLTLSLAVMRLTASSPAITKCHPTVKLENCTHSQNLGCLRITLGQSTIELIAVITIIFHPSARDLPKQSMIPSATHLTCHSSIKHRAVRI